MNSRKTRGLMLGLLLTLMGVLPVLAQGITIDGSFADWTGKTSVVDTGGVDDETSPARADITEFRADSDSGGLYLLKAWDDTSFTGGNATTAGVTVQAANGTYYRIYTTAAGNPGSVPLSSLDIKSCTDSTCKTQTDVCAGSGCSGAQAGSGTSWTDPFSGSPGHGGGQTCNGTNCGTQDTAVELYIPWTLIGGAPGDGQFILLQFGSYPSGPGQGPKDSAGNGIACWNNGGTFQCYVYNPTAVTLESFQAVTVSDTMPWAGIVLVLASAILIGLCLKTAMAK